MGDPIYPFIRKNTVDSGGMAFAHPQIRLNYGFNRIEEATSYPEQEKVIRFFPSVRVNAVTKQRIPKRKPIANGLIARYASFRWQRRRAVAVIVQIRNTGSGCKLLSGDFGLAARLRCQLNPQSPSQSLHRLRNPRQPRLMVRVE